MYRRLPDGESADDGPSVHHDCIRFVGATGRSPKARCGAPRGPKWQGGAANPASTKRPDLTLPGTFPMMKGDGLHLAQGNM